MGYFNAIRQQKQTASTKEALSYIESYWPKLERHRTHDNGTLIGLPHRYIIPSLGRGDFEFFEQYYWDSYFTVLGIDDETLACGILDNLIHLFGRFGLIPNASRMYMMSRSQPPVLTSLIFLIYERFGKNLAWLKEHMVVAEEEYETVWMNQSHPLWHNVHLGLSRYYDINVLHDLAEAESGWDMTPRFERKCLDFLPVDLNSMLYKYEADFARAAGLLGKTAAEQTWLKKASNRKNKIDKLMWGKLRAFYFDYNFEKKALGNVWSLAGFYPMWAGLASPDHAQKMVDNLWRFEKKGGLTTTASIFMYPQLFGSLKTQWAYPNGWAPLHYIVIEGLERYGYHEEAERIAKKWLQTNLDWFAAHGEFQEKYNVVQPLKKPVEGLYPAQTGFGWTNGIFKYLAQRYY